MVDALDLGSSSGNGVGVQVSPFAFIYLLFKIHLGWNVMEVSVDNLSSVKKLLHIEIPEEDVIAEINKAYQDIKNTAKIKGFRKGKAPRNVLERMFKKDVHTDVVSKLVQNSVYPAINKTGLKAVGQPVVEPAELSDTGPYKYDAFIEVTPELDDIDFKGLALKKNIYKVTEKEIETQVQMLQRNLAEHKAVQEDRAIRDEDLVLLNYEVFKDGASFQEVTKTENFKLKIGENLISKEIDEALIGLKPGDTKDIDIKFPDDHFKDNLAGVEVTFNVKINEILEEILPELDDEFIKKLGQFQSFDDLKNAITDNLKQGYTARINQELSEQVFTAILAKIDFEVPEVMTENELQGIIAPMAQSYPVKEMTPEELEKLRDDLAAKYRGLAEMQVKRHLILTKVADQEKLTLSDEEIEEGLRDMAARLNLPVDDIKKKYSRDMKNMEFFKQTLLEKQAMCVIIERSTIEEVEPEK